MTAGHFGLAAAVKPWAPRVPLWALMLATYLLDMIFIFLASGGVESFSQVDPSHPAYGGALIHADYSHSLVGAALIAVFAGLVAGYAWKNRFAGLVIGGVVFSHWLLDLVVHRPDMPILPGHMGGLPLLGLGLWNFPVASALVELLLALGGGWLYFRGARRTPAGQKSANRPVNRAIMAAGVTSGLIVLLLASDVLNLPLLIGIVLMLAIIVVGGVLDARLDWREVARPLPATGRT